MATTGTITMSMREIERSQDDPGGRRWKHARFDFSVAYGIRISSELRALAELMPLSLTS